MLQSYSSVGNQILYLGDCLELLKELSTESVQTILTGPPYFETHAFGNGTWEGGDATCSHTIPSDGTQRNKKGYRDVCKSCGAVRLQSDVGLTLDLQQYVDSLVVIFKEARRVLAKNGTFWLVSGDSYSDGTGIAAKNLYAAPWKLAIALQEDGWYLRSDIIWEKPSISPFTAPDRPTRSHDYIFLFSKEPHYYYNANAIREPTADGGSRHVRTVWSFAPETYRASGYDYAIFPQHLVARCIAAATQPGDIVLDPFCGAATVGVVAMQLKRCSVGIELSPKYIEIASKRLRITQEAMRKSK